MNVGKMLSHCAQRFPDKTAVVFGKESLTFHQVNLMVCRVSTTLKQLGITRGERVALMLPNTSHFVIAYLGVLKLGAVCVPLDIRFKGEELRGIVEDAQIKLFITTDELYEYCIPFFKALTLPLTVIAVEGEGGKEQRGYISFDELVRDEALSEETTVEIQDDEEALYLYTSGTTGKIDRRLLAATAPKSFHTVLSTF